VVKYAVIMNVSTELFKQVKTQALDNSIPCISDSTGNFLELLVRMNRSRKIIEIGTGNGYSTLFFLNSVFNRHVNENSYTQCCENSTFDNEFKLFTFEKDKQRFDMAAANLKQFIDSGAVSLICDDALNHISEVFSDGEADFLFIDGTKRQYTEALKQYWHKLKNGAIIFSDDVFFRGVLDPENALKRHKGIIEGLRGYNSFLDEFEKSGFIKNYFFQYENGMSVSIKIK